jgi:hypothetical protein
MHPPLENNPIRHTLKIKAQMRQIIDHLRKGIGNVTEAKAQALFETSEAVLTRLVKAFDDYEQRGENAWRTELRASFPKGRYTHGARGILEARLKVRLHQFVRARSLTPKKRRTSAVLMKDNL